MEKTTVSYVGEDFKFPTSTHGAEEVADKVGISEERLIELADAELIPHYRIDGGPPLFRLTELKPWIARHLTTQCMGADDLPFQFRVMQVAKPVFSKVPDVLTPIRNLRQIHLQDFAPSVYFLCANDAVIYVGQSTSVAARLAAHRNNHLLMGKFDRVFVLHVPLTLLDQVEGAFIRHLNPPMNANPGPHLQPGDKEKIIAEYTQEDGH